MGAINGRVSTSNRWMDEDQEGIFHLYLESLSTMNEAAIIEALKTELQAEFANESTGHDWYHIERVWKNARSIAEKEGGNGFIIELGALLHDIADHKFVANADQAAITRVNELLGKHGVHEEIIGAVLHIVLNCSFKGGMPNKMKTREGLVVQDADRLDAIGAIGIARTFAFGGKFNRAIYDPAVKPATFTNEVEYRGKRSHTINHFYEKLLLLKDGMNTETGKQMAAERHRYMEGFLAEFYAEWEGKK
jgi:uncharacterized protein